MCTNWLNNFMQNRQQVAEDTSSFDDEVQEDEDSYCKDGYHPVAIGDVYHKRYSVVRKLGWGEFSTVWLCRDLNNAQFVALKIVKNAAEVTKAAINEIKLLKYVRQMDTFGRHKGKIVKLLDNFRITGVNGTHECIVSEVLGHNLLKFGKGLPIAEVKGIVRQVLQGLDYLHTTCNIIHTDIKPENICRNKNGSITIADLGNSCWVDRQLSDVIQTRQYRSPEVILGAGYGPAADIWSTACVAFELATGNYLFSVQCCSKWYSRDETHLGEIVAMVGEIPERVAFSSEKFKWFFTEKGKLCHFPRFQKRGILDLLTKKHGWGVDEARDFEDFLMPMLNIDQDERSSAKDCLRHRWLERVAMGFIHKLFIPVNKILKYKF